MPVNDSVVQDARRLLAAMTREEKIELVHGVDTLWTRGVPRLGVRKLRMSDASMGLRDDLIPATAFPAFIALAATWSPERAAAYGQAVAEEYRAAGVDVLLGPGVNLYRTACCGRNFEYLGEDPCLTSQLAVAYIRAAQAEGVSTTVKHFAANNSDWHRCCSNSVVDERTLREVYFQAFEAAVKEGGTRALMTSYNLLNGEYTACNRWLSHKVLREDWGFDGVVMSDWNGTRDLGKAFRAGMDLDMPGVSPQNGYPKPLRDLLDSGQLTPEALDRSVFQILKWTLEIQKMQEGRARPPRGKCADHAAVALQTAREGMVLLRNRDNLLPLNAKPGMRICVAGPAANPTPTSGGGAAEVKAVDPVSILGAICALAPEATVLRTDRAEELAKADAVIVCVGYDAEREREGLDRPWELNWHRDVNVIRHCQNHNSNTIVVIVAGGGVEMASWIDKTAAVLHAWYPGENGCQAIAEILFGTVNPSGRLPISIARSWEDGAAADYMPPGGSHYTVPDYDWPARAVFDVKYAEGVFVGYRHFDRTGKTPLFPFGFGLSYTTFEYAGLRVQKNAAGGVDVTFRVRNTGTRAGAEVAQVYVGDVQSSVPRPVKELKGFARLVLDSGQEQETTVTLDRRAFAFYDVARQDWVVEPGDFRICVASNAQDVRLEAKLAM